MKYYMYRLAFLTPVHFGAAEGGGSLEAVDLLCHSDTLFGALCQEAARTAIMPVERLVELVETGAVAFSSLFPYSEEAGHLKLYLPRPLYSAPQRTTQVLAYRAMCEEAAQAKKVKKLRFCRASDLVAASKGQALDTFKGAYKLHSEKVNAQGEVVLPYMVGSYTFARGSGLYGIVAVAEETDALLLEQLLTLLGLTGIGGKVSSGYGKFQLCAGMEELSTMEQVDGVSLQRMLTHVQAPIQMTLSTLCPRREEVEAVSAGEYKLLLRSGFVNEGSTQVKRPSVYMLAEGSCLRQRMQGQVVAMTVAGLTHKLYRYGVGMYVGVE